MNRRRTPSPGTSRLLVLCALLLGLFLMHGSPAAATEGCHTGAAAMPAMAPISAGLHADGMEQTPHVHAATGLADHEGSTEGLCVSAPVRGQVVVPAALLLALIPLTVTGLLWPAQIAGVFTGLRRGPPQAGRNLLHQVCIART